jgi:uncharacterized protein (DUF2062 family)
MRRYLRDKLPKPESILDNKYLGFLKPYLGHPRLWHLHRRSVALGVSIGLVTGLIPGPIQMLLAIGIAIPMRANVLVAAATTLYTNPLTFVPLYVLAYTIGAAITGAPIVELALPDFNYPLSESWRVVPAMFQWFASLGGTLLIGLAGMSTLFALSGYVVTTIVWRCVVSKMWLKRHRRAFRAGGSQ